MLPVLSGIEGYIVGALAGWVFNRVAALSGGLEIEVELSAEPGPGGAAAAGAAIGS